MLESDPGEKAGTVKVRPLLVDARTKEFTLGLPHDITERLFVVRRALRLNDSLPQENSATPQWVWERGGWLLVDRLSGKVSPINLPDFDGSFSTVVWYRDYAAYCGISDDGKGLYAIVAQLSRRRPVVKQLIEGRRKSDASQEQELADSACNVGSWERGPVRVTFDVKGLSKITFAVRGHASDLLSEEDETEEAAK